jgi:tryptophan-rich sensory protein
MRIMRRSSVYPAVLLIITVAICLTAGVIGSFFTTPNIPTWYADLNKPWFTPPSWVFGPVWTILYILMGISLFLVLRKGWERRDVQIGTAVFGIQLVLNILWSYLFFGLRSPLYGLIGIVALWIAILATIVWFFRISRPAAILLVPYIAWVSIATALNYSIYILNP